MSHSLERLLITWISVKISSASLLHREMQKMSQSIRTTSGSFLGKEPIRRCSVHKVGTAFDMKIYPGSRSSNLVRWSFPNKPPKCDCSLLSIFPHWFGITFGQKKLRKGNLFSNSCQSVHGGPLIGPQPVPCPHTGHCPLLWGHCPNPTSYPLPRHFQTCSAWTSLYRWDSHSTPHPRTQSYEIWESKTSTWFSQTVGRQVRQLVGLISVHLLVTKPSVINDHQDTSG